VQPYVPQYRVPFFTALLSRLDELGIEGRVVAASPTGELSARGDAAEQAAWIDRFPPKRWHFGGRHIDIGGSKRLWQDADAVILFFQGTLVDAYRALYGPGRANRRVGLWGHIDSYIAPWNPVDRWLETRLARDADRIFAYTPGGAATAERLGVPTERITTVMNSIATNDLLLRHAEFRSGANEEFKTKHGLGAGPTFGYIGSLDASKRVDLLAQALDELWRIDPAAKLVVGGTGRDAGLLDAAVERGQVIRLGYADDEGVALIGSVSEAIMNPGRIGLVAVHALAMGLPIVTSEYRFHAPELEYLREGETVFTASDDPGEFARTSINVAQSSDRIRGGQWAYPTLDAMVDNFASGVVKLMA